MLGMDGKIALSHFAGHMGNVGEQGIEGVHNAFGGVGQYTHFVLAFDLRSRSGQVAFLQQGQALGAGTDGRGNAFGQPDAQ